MSSPLAFSAGYAQDRLEGPVQAQVLRVVDGDTLHVRARIWLRQDIETMVRLTGLDTPELRGKCPEERDLARQARSFVEQRVEGRTVRLRSIAQDKYGGRVLAVVETENGEDLAQALIAAGLGRPYDGRARQPWCAAQVGEMAD